jgi:hypothetical protein
MLKTAILLAVAMLAPLVSAASTLSFNGAFGQDESLEWFRVTMNAPGALTVRTWSFAGGVNADGTTIPAGGFAPVLSLFEETGFQLLLAVDHAGGSGPDCGPRPADPFSGFCWDGYLSTSVGAGSYLLALTEDDNLPFGPTLSEGFSRTGQGNFTGPNFLGQPGSFLLVSGEQRTSEWALDIDADEAVALPEPGTAQFLGAGILLACLARMRFKE